MVEHVTFNHGVEGSIPSALTKQINGLVCLSNSASAGLVSGQRRKSSALSSSKFEADRKLGPVVIRFMPNDAEITPIQRKDDL